MKVSIIEHTMVTLLGIVADKDQNDEMRTNAFNLLETLLTTEEFLFKIKSEVVNEVNSNKKRGLDPTASPFIPNSWVTIKNDCVSTKPTDGGFPQETIDFLADLVDSKKCHK